MRCSSWLMRCCARTGGQGPGQVSLAPEHQRGHGALYEAVNHGVRCPTPSEIRQLMVYIKTHVVARRNARGGRSAQEHLVAALRCLYQRAVDDGLIAEADNPARKVAKPRRLPTTRRALPDARLAEINEIAATTGDDPELDTLILRLHTETACRRGAGTARAAAARFSRRPRRRAPRWSR